jgi:hypothetical protein
VRSFLRLAVGPGSGDLIAIESVQVWRENGYSPRCMVNSFGSTILLGFAHCSDDEGQHLHLQVLNYVILSQIMGASSLLLVGTYPLFKRFTYWVRVVHGL